MGATRKELPGGWAEASIGDVTIKKVRHTIPSLDSYFTYIDISSIDNASKQIVSQKELRGEQAPSRARQSVFSNDVLVSMTRPNLNAVAIVSEDLNNSIASTGFDVLRAIEVEPQWLFHHVRSREFVQEMTALVQGALYPAIKGGDVRGYRIPIPPLNEQKRIVAKIEKLQTCSRRAREALETIPDLLEQLRRATLAAAFRGDLTKDWRMHNPDVEPASELLKRIRAERRKLWEEAELAKPKAKGLPGDQLDERLAKRHKKYKEPATVDTSNLPQLPKTWYWCLLQEVGYMNRGKSRHRPRNAPHLYGGKYPFIQTGDIAKSNGRITNHKQTYSEAGLAQSKLWPEGTVCITIAANIASSAVLTYPACFPDSVVGIIPDGEICPSEYVEFFIRTIRNELEQFAPATAQKNINIGILNKVVLPLPPRREIDEILKLLQISFARVETTEASLESALTDLNQLDENILYKGFCGELLPQDPSDEPASVLLNRIAEEQAKKETTKRLKRKPRKHHKKPPRKESMMRYSEAQKDYLFSILANAKNKNLSPEGLWNRSNMDIDDFYAQLKSEIMDGVIEERIVDNSTRLIQVKK